MVPIADRVMMRLPRRQRVLSDFAKGHDRSLAVKSRCQDLVKQLKKCVRSSGKRVPSEDYRRNGYVRTDLGDRNKAYRTGSIDGIRATGGTYQYPRVFADSIELVPQQPGLRAAHASLPRSCMIRWKEKSVTDARRRVLS